MKSRKRVAIGLAVLLPALAWLLTGRRDGHAYIEAPMSLGSVISQSHNIVYMQLESVDTDRNVLRFKKLADLKGRHPSDEVIQYIGQAGFHPREWQNIMKWAKPGKKAVFFHNGRASETCIDTYWYQCYGNSRNWRMSHAEPYLLRTYAGKPNKLRSVVEAVLRGEEVIAPAMVDSSKEQLQLRKAKLQRLKVGLNRLDYNPQRDFVGWGGGELEDIQGMAGFSHRAVLPGVAPEAIGVSAADFDDDGKIDICLFGTSRVVLLHNEDKTFAEVSLPLPAKTGARAAAWTDYNRDGRPDLLLACPWGPVLLTGVSGARPFRNDTVLLPRLPAWNVTCALWIDADTDGWPDVVVNNGFHGLRLFKNPGRKSRGEFTDEGEICPDLRPALPDLTTSAQAVGVKGDHLVVGDVNNDGRSDMLLCAGRGVLLLNTEAGFVVSSRSGLDFDVGAVGPAFGDFDRDGDLDLFVPGGGLGRLFRNDGQGRFHDVSTQAIGVVLGARGRATSAAWGDLDCDGWLDLVVTCVRGPNRVLFNGGDGSFHDVSRRLGTTRRTFNSQGICLADVDGDGDLDFALANENKDSCVLLSTLSTELKYAPVDVVLPPGRPATGADLRIFSLGAATGDGEKVRGALALKTELGGVQGRGSGPPPSARIGLPIGDYLAELRYSSGEVRQVEFSVGRSSLLVEIADEQ